MAYSNMLDIAKQLAEGTGDRITDDTTDYTFHPDEIVLINESESVRTIAAVTAGLTTNSLMVDSGERSFREVIQGIIDAYNADNSRQFITTGVDMAFEEFKITNFTFQVINHTLSVIAYVPTLDLYRSGDMLADYLKLYLLIVAKITKLKVGKLRMCVRDSYILKNDVNAIRDMPNNNTAEVVLSDTLTDLDFTAIEISLKT